MSFAGFQMEDVERPSFEGNEFITGQNWGPKSNKLVYVAGASVALLAVCSLGLVQIHSQPRSIASLTALASRTRIATPEQVAEAAKEAESRRIAGLSHSYLPAANYEDPCDAVRIDCCTDPSFPVLGGVDVVRFGLTGDIVFGNPKYTAQVTGLSRTYTFWFSDKSLVPIFEANREAYFPKWGGFDVGDFCAVNSNLETLVKKTVDLNEAQDIDRHVAFHHTPIENMVECDTAFNSLYGFPINGVFNTRCVSMNNFQRPVAGLLPQMPLVAVPVKMSELYGVAPISLSQPVVESEQAHGQSDLLIPDALENGKQQEINQFQSVAAEIAESNQIAVSDTLSNEHARTVEFSTDISNENGRIFDSPIEDDVLSEENESTVELSTETFSDVHSLSQDQVGQNEWTEEATIPSIVSEYQPITEQEGQSAEAFSDVHSLSQDQVGQNEWTEDETIASVSEYQPIAEQESQSVERADVSTEMHGNPQNWHTSAKPLGEKALLKRGVVKMEDLSPGILKQLAEEEGILSTDAESGEEGVSQ